VEQCLIHFVIVVIIFMYFFLINYKDKKLWITITIYSPQREIIYILIVFSITELFRCVNNIYMDFCTLCRYNVRWYIAPLHVQKLILFLLQRERGNKTFILHLGGIFGLSLEFFATVKVIYIIIFILLHIL